ncbi:MAG: hypothetical protein ACWA5K_02340, partial [bacterium]
MTQLRILLCLVIGLAPIGVAAGFCAEPAWQDQFNGEALDTSRWQIVEGDGCDQNLCNWGNDELQWYS